MKANESYCVLFFLFLFKVPHFTHRKFFLVEIETKTTKKPREQLNIQIYLWKIEGQICPVSSRVIFWQTLRPVPSDWKHNNQYCFVVLQPKQQSTVLCRASLVAQVEEEAEDSIEVKDLCTLLKKHPEKQKLLQRLKCCRCLL